MTTHAPPDSLAMRGDGAGFPLQPAGGVWFAVMDAAQDSTFLFLTNVAAIRRQSLYAGALGALLDDVAPHLVEFRADSGFAAWFTERWERPCGILLRSAASFDELRKHLRQFLLVTDAGKRYRFRFYDP